MKTRAGMAAGVLLMCALSAAAQDRGYWRADSSMAKQITGDVTISETKLMIGFSGFTIAEIRALKPAEAGAAFDADTNAGGNGNLYRLNIPAGKRFAHHNTLCGEEETQWMATWVAGNDLTVAFFSGATMPELTPEALMNSTARCGTFTYQR